MSDCIFCKIIDKKIPAKIIYEDEYALAFEDANPQAPVHTLIVPRRHIPTVLDLKEGDDKLIGHLFMVANSIARDKGIAARGFRIVANCNREGGQIVYHMHIHILGGRQLRGPLG